MNLVKLADQSVETFGEITKLIFQDRAYSNLELISSANRFANGLAGIGIQPLDKVLVLMMNSPKVVITYQAILRAGAIVIPVIYTLGTTEIRHILKNSRANTIITEKAFLDKARQACRSLKTLEHIIIMDKKDCPGTHNYRQLTHPYPDTAPQINISHGDTAVILYTSGTTGIPKGVMLTHKNLYANAVSLSQMDPNRDPKTTSLFFLPLSHSFGLTMMNLGFLIPNKSVIMARFELEAACRLIEKYKIFKFAGVPTVFSLMLNHPRLSEIYDLSSLTECGCGSAPLPRNILVAFEKRFNCIILEGYGLSEAAPAVAGNYKERLRKPGSVGQPLPGVEIQIVDNKGNRLEQDEVGELLVRGDNVSPGYYDLPDQTAANFKNNWLYTGDMARIDKDNYLFIVNRKKELIIRGGFNIFPRDIEDVLYLHPAVDEGAVFGVPDKIMGEKIIAYVSLLPGSFATKEQIINHCHDHLAKFKCPEQIHFIDSMPRNLIGKILKKNLLKLYQSRSVSKN
ncbi:MAG: long-chain fatty acid--CoA ligase [Desulfobacteraceae bacterium]|nr:long-chain fatty acid--CoA ligase [Desulfobacteraceae bacterium]